MKTVRAHALPWVAGTLLAFAGVALARAVAPSFTGATRIAMTLAGQFLALGGLFVISLGVRRRIRRAAGQ